MSDLGNPRVIQQLMKEHRIKRENIHVVGISCDGMLDMESLETGIGMILGK